MKEPYQSWGFLQFKSWRPGEFRIHVCLKNCCDLSPTQLRGVRSHCLFVRPKLQLAQLPLYKTLSLPLHLNPQEHKSFSGNKHIQFHFYSILKGF